MDEDGYPTEEELKIISEWDILKKDVSGLIEYIRERWMYSDCGYFDLKGKKVLKLRLSTAGWSGNESIIGALKNNPLFWTLYWEISKRGGHYWFIIKRLT